METSSASLLAFLMNGAWQLALIASAAAFCDWLLRDAPARRRHRLWVAALALSLCLPVLTSSRLLKETFSQRRPRPQAVENYTDAVPAPLSQEIDREISLDAATSPVALTPAPRGEAGAFIPVGRKVASTLIALYVLFLCYRSLKLFRAWLRTRAMKRNAYAVGFSEQLQTAIDRCQNATGVRHAGILCSGSVAAPVTVGAFKPLVLLPEYLLRESDANLLTSAIGHEFIHILRRDYLLNLLYELIYLPLSFHPAARLMKRRINQTRELGCDELVTEKLLDAHAYARSLVQLAGAAVPFGRPTTTISVGVADADILEERVMTMLKRSKSTVRRQGWSLIAAALCLAAPCMAAAPFALRVNIDSQEAAVTTLQGGAGEPGVLFAWLKSPGETVERGDAIASLRTDKGLIKVEAETGGVIERLLARVGEKVPAGASLVVIRPQRQPDGEEITPAQQEERERKEAREAKLKAEAELEARLRMEREAQSSRPEAGTYTVNTIDGEKAFTIAQDPQVEMKRKEERRLLEARMREEKERAEREAQDPEIIAHRKAEREAMARRQAELARDAKISMQQAIQIVSSQYPGTVLNSRLTRERDQACYVLSILSDNGAESTTTFVIMSAIDGSILKVEKE
jgi:beta-lactamase regulating signal transducer with metallopeptidase domain/biotin carboxyl carrier protein